LLKEQIEKLDDMALAEDDEFETLPTNNKELLD
jgi:hypothetical protein